MTGPYRYTTPVRKKAAAGRVAEVYSQMATDFVLMDGPLMSLSPAPDVLAATWALLREAQLAGRAPRVGKEVVAAAVSVANRCPFCASAHTMLVHATGHHRLAEAVLRGERPAEPEQARLAAWAAATATASASELTEPPVADCLAVEYLGTALVTHFITRMTSALLDEEALAGRARTSPLVRRIAGMALARTIRRPLRPGRSMALLIDLPVGATPSWAEDTSIGYAIAVLRAVAAAGGALLSPSARDAVQASVSAWDGAHPPLSGGKLEQGLAGLSSAERPGASLALLAAIAPYRVTDADVAAWRGSHRNDAELVRLLAYGAMAAVDRIEAWSTLEWRASRLSFDAAVGPAPLEQIAYSNPIGSEQ